MKANNIEIPILYEDNHLLVVVKPRNILSQEDNTKDLDILTLLKKYLKEKYHKPGDVYLGLVHRLDRPTGGVMVFARTSKAASRLSKQIKEHQFSKKYYAIVHGILEEKTGIMEDYLEKTSSNSSVVTTKEKGKFASLSYQVLSEDLDKNLSLVDISLQTGRHHQIRVAFSSRKHPLYGDLRYGNKDSGVLGLFAYELSFIHPTTKEKLTFQTAPSGDVWDLFKEFYHVRD